MLLCLDLTPAEDSAIHGWLNYYLANPAYIGVPRPPVLPPPGTPPTWQTRIVLDDMTRARFDQIAAAYGQASLPVTVLEPYAPGKFFEERQTFVASAEQVIAIPFTLPAGPFQSTNHWYGSSAEYQGAPVLRHATVSRTAGDMVGIARSTGTNVTIDLFVGIGAGETPPGLYYWNIWQEPGTAPQPTSFTALFPH